MPVNDYNSSADSNTAAKGVERPPKLRNPQKKVTDIEIMNAAHNSRMQRMLNATNSNSKVVDSFANKLAKITGELNLLE